MNIASNDLYPDPNFLIRLRSTEKYLNCFFHYYWYRSVYLNTVIF